MVLTLLLNLVAKYTDQCAAAGAARVALKRSLHAPAEKNLLNN